LWQPQQATALLNIRSHSLIRVTAPTSLSLESNFELERIKRSIDAMDDLELLKHLAKQMAEMMHAQKHVTKQLLNPRQRQSFGFEA
jgi:hypothetical protein